MRITLCVTALSLLAAATACNSAGCLDNGNALPLAGFYAKGSDKSVTIDSIQIQGIGAPKDTLLLASPHAASQIYMPMRPDSPSTAWVFSYRQRAIDRPELNDTVTFAVKHIPYFVSQDCGAMYFYRIEGVKYTRHLIDSVAITDSLITNVERERIKIYFRVAGEGSEL